MIDRKKRTRLQAMITSAHHDFGKGLNVHAFFKTRNRATSEDLVQDTFMKTWSYLVRGGKIDVMKAFLYHTLNHLIIDAYRKRKAISLDILLEKGFEPSVDDSGRLLNILDGKSVLLLIQRLPEKYQQVLRMRYVQELSLDEMSQVTEKTKNTLTVQIHRGLKKLKLLYNAH